MDPQPLVVFLSDSPDRTLRLGQIILGLVLCGAGVLVARYPVRDLRSWTRLRRHGVQVPGTLATRVGAVTKVVRFHFRTLDGREETVEQILGPPTRIRERDVTVVYDPEDPRHARVIGVQRPTAVAANGCTAVLVPLLFLAIGVVFVLLGVAHG